MTDVTAPATPVAPAAKSSPAPAPTKASATPAPKPAAAPTPQPGAGKNAIGNQIAAPPAPEVEAAPEPEAPKPPERRKYKLKVDGNELEEDLTDDEISVRLQKAVAAEKRMQEAAAIRKRWDTIVEFGKNDPIRAAKELWGADMSEIVQQRLADDYQRLRAEQAMTPEQKLQAEYEAKLQAAANEKAALEKQITDRQQAETDAKVLEQTKKDFVTALQAVGQDASYETLYEMAALAKLNLQQGLELTPAQMAEEVKTKVEGQREKLHKRVLGGLKGDRLLQHLGPEVTKEVIRATLEKQKGARAAAATPPPAKPKPVEVDKTPLTKRDMRRRMFGID